MCSILEPHRLLRLRGGEDTPWLRPGGYTGVKGLDALLAVLSTPDGGAGDRRHRLRHGASNSVRGAARLLADALATARRAGATGS
jgi:hypothetical protein